MIFSPILIQVFVFFGSVGSKARLGHRSRLGKSVCQDKPRRQSQTQSRYLKSCLSCLIKRLCGRRDNSRPILAWLYPSPLKTTQEAFSITLLGRRTPFPVDPHSTRELGSGPEV